MPSFDILRKSTPVQTFRVASVCGTYDLQTNAIEEHFVGNIDLPNKWNIGLIVGRSGTGKTTIAKELFSDFMVQEYTYTHECLLDDFPKEASMQQIYKALNSVGFSSPPSWLKSYHVLSNGEKMRCDLARAIVENKDMFVFDEFTSVVDRNVAQIGSLAMQKAIRRQNKQFIAVTCHYDVEEWLQPDWVFCTDDFTFRICEVQKKNINIDIFEVRNNKERLWDVFRKYHYLSHSFNKASRVFVATYKGNLCAFVAILPFPHPIKKHTWKGHRTVVLPDFQGVGIARAFTDKIGHILHTEGKKFISTTSNPNMINARLKSPNWKCTHQGRISSGSRSGLIQNKHKKGSTSCNRITASFEYYEVQQRED